MQEQPQQSKLLLLSYEYCPFRVCPFCYAIYVSKSERQRWGRPIAAFRKRDEKEKRKRVERGKDSSAASPEGGARRADRRRHFRPGPCPCETYITLWGVCQRQIVKTLALIFCQIVQDAANPGKWQENRHFPRENRPIREKTGALPLALWQKRW